MMRKKTLTFLLMLGFLVVGGCIAGHAQELKQIKSWTIYEGKSGGIRGRIDSYSIDSDGTLVETKNAKSTTRKIAAVDLQELEMMLKELKLPGTKSKIVKGDGIYDGLTIRLDSKTFKIEGNSFYDEKQLVLIEAQKQMLGRLKRKLTEIRTGQLSGRAEMRVLTD